MRFKNEFKVGILTIITIIIFYAGFTFLKGEDFFSVNNTYYVMYDNVEGLKESTNITLNGVIVGKVVQKEILPQKNYRILIKIEVNHNYRLTADAKSVMNKDILGNTSIYLRMGESNQYLQSRDTLEGEVVLSVFEDLKKTTRDELGPTKEKLEKLLDSFVITLHNMNKLMLDNQYNIHQITKNLNLLINETRIEVKNLTPLVNNMNRLIDTVKSIPVKKSLKTFDNSINHLSDLLLKIQSPKSTLGRLVNEDSIYQHFSILIKNMNQLIQHFDENPKHFLAPLGKNRKKSKLTEKKRII